MTKQGELIEGRGIKELDNAAESLKELRDKRISLLRKEIEASEMLLKLMRKHKREAYSYNGYEVEIVPGKDKVKVRSPKEDENGDDE